MFRRKNTEYFGHYRDQQNFGVKVFLYKNQGILVRYKSIMSCDLTSQKKIWEYKFPKGGITYSLLKADTLFFSTWIDKVATVVAYNIVKQLVIWKKQIREAQPNIAPPDYEASYLLFQDHDNLIVPTFKSCYAIDMNTGNVAGKVNWEPFFNPNLKNVLFKVEDNYLFITDLNDGNGSIKCINMTTNKMIWTLKDAYFLGLYKDYVIANDTAGNII